MAKTFDGEETASDEQSQGDGPRAAGNCSSSPRRHRRPPRVGPENFKKAPKTSPSTYQGSSLA